MTHLEEMVGRVVGVDPRLLEEPEDLAALTLGARHDQALSFFTTATQRLVTVATPEFGAGPDRILVERVPPISQPLPGDGWKIEKGFLHVPGGKRYDLTAVARHPTMGLTIVRDFPGHMRGALARHTRKAWPELERRLHDLGGALKKHLTEEVELPILRVIGFGPGALPVGDMALCGLLLTGRALGMGRAPVHWLTRLSMEVRRFQHRTTRFGAAYLKFALEGRTTAAQETFFRAMARDFEGAVELAVEGIARERDASGPGFLVGVRVALDMIRADVFAIPVGAAPAA